jgi:hypothetical protein
MDKLHEILRGGDMSKEKGVIKHQSEKLVTKAKEKFTPDLAPEEPVREAVKPEPVKKASEVKTVRRGIDNHLIDSLEFDLKGEKFLVNSVHKGGSDIPADRVEEIEKAANQQGYFLARVE